MWRICNQQTIDAPKILDEIEGNVYAVLKPLGFRKFGRTLHRFVSGDLSQVVNFQIWGDRFCVNLGIRVPECDERLNPPSNKKYYHEYSCTLRSRLGQVSGKHETWFDLRKKTEKTSKKIIKELLDIVIPSYEVLNSRNAILQKSGEYPNYWFTCELLDKCMIYLNMGDIEKAKECKGLNHREASVLLACNIPELNEEIYALARKIKEEFYEKTHKYIYDLIDVISKGKKNVKRRKT